MGWPWTCSDVTAREISLEASCGSSSLPSMHSSIMIDRHLDSEMQMHPHKLGSAKQSQICRISLCTIGEISTI